MTFKIIVAGKASHAYAKQGIEQYLKRLKRYGKVELIIVKDGDSVSVSERLLKAAEGSFLIAMDERGKDFTSKQFSDAVLGWTEDPAVKAVSFLIGASDGHTEELRQKAGLLLRLSYMTMMHELALVVLLEQLYRAHTIIRGEPYHR